MNIFLLNFFFNLAHMNNQSLGIVSIIIVGVVFCHFNSITGH